MVKSGSHIAACVCGRIEGDADRAAGVEVCVISERFTEGKGAELND